MVRSITFIGGFNQFKAITNLTLAKPVHHGLDPQQQWYVYDNIRQFFKKPEACDKVCPKPLMSKQVVKIESTDESNETSDEKRNIPF